MNADGDSQSRRRSKRAAVKRLVQNRALRLAMMMGFIGASTGGQAGKLRALRAMDTGYVTLLITIFVLLATAAGALQVPEQWMYDLRTRYFQFGRPAPTDRLVHVDMDDAAIDALGRWPWSRSVQAQLIEELAAAGPKAVAIDIIYDKPEEPTWNRNEDGTFFRVEHDARFVEALKKLPGSVVGLSHEEKESESADDPKLQEAVGMLVAEPGMEEGEFARRLPTSKELFIRARTSALAFLVKRAVNEGLSLEAITAKIDSQGMHEISLVQSPLRRAIADAYAREMARRALAPYRVDAPDGVLNTLWDRPPELLPLPEITKAASMAAFFDYIKEGDGTMRRIPLIIEEEGQASLSLGLALAIQTLDVDLRKIQISPTQITLPAPGRTIRIPIRQVHFQNTNRTFGGVFDLPWFSRSRGDKWETMYDAPNAPVRHTISMVELADSVALRNRMAANNVQLREIYTIISQNLDHAKDLQEALAKPYDPFDPEAWAKRVEALVTNEDVRAAMEMYKQEPPVNPGARPTTESAESLKDWESKKFTFDFYNAVRSATGLIAETRALGHESVEKRRSLRDRIADKAVLVGWTATGRTDFVATPLHAACAGVRIHGVVFNSIMTGNFLQFAPDWLNLLVTGLLGLVMTYGVVRLTPPAAMLAAMGLAAVYTGINALLFGPTGYVMALAAPFGAIAATWAFGSAFRFFEERAARKRIEKRFSTYVDPQLVNYLLANPDQASVAGERRTMTVVFTDLAGFTSLSEKLGEETVQILNDYFALMVPIIRKHNGYLNKLLGDGMMFFFNAPLPNENQTTNAFDAVLEMQAAVRQFNEDLTAKGLPNVKMRVGITRGEMIAGDAGGVEYADYTVLGDNVNLASRLEGANKASGTLIICNREAALAGAGDFITRPIGTLQVVGKTQGIDAFEVMGRRASSPPLFLSIAELSERMVAAYKRGDLDACCESASALEKIGDTSYIPKLYKRLSDLLRENGMPANFDGTVVLETK